jgi:hypothetical protein
MQAIEAESAKQPKPNHGGHMKRKMKFILAAFTTLLALGALAAVSPLWHTPLNPAASSPNWQVWDGTNSAASSPNVFMY